MIGFLEGTVSLIDAPYVFLDVHGVGYKIYATSTVLSSVVLDETRKVFTYTHVREDILELYGFVTHADLKLFEQLIGVSGIGPKTAIGIFSIGTSSDIINAIALGDVEFFTSVPRLGKKNAQKLIIELKNKIGGLEDLDLGSPSGKENSDIKAALRGFGFETREIDEAIRAVKDQGQNPEEKIRAALKYLGK